MAADSPDDHGTRTERYCEKTLTLTNAAQKTRWRAALQYSKLILIICSHVRPSAALPTDWKAQRFCFLPLE